MKPILIPLIALLLSACGNAKSSSSSQAASSSSSETASSAASPAGPTFSADSAYLYCQQQCDFGPRTMNSEAHDRCGRWIASKFQEFGMQVLLQRADLRGYDGTLLKSTNIIASYRPELKARVMLCAHWDSRPWADNDPDEANHRKPVMAANDGASGVAVMLEVARLLSQTGGRGGDEGKLDGKTVEHTNGEGKLDGEAGGHTNDKGKLEMGVDFVCFDAEDWGTPQWAESNSNDADTWALGAQYWSKNPHKGHKPRYGILLDMVGGQGARFYQEQVSMYFAADVVRKVWKAAETAGYGSFFPKDEGGQITDDHLPVNQYAGIPCIDIIPYYPDCEQSSFGPTWHTVSDDMQHIDKNTLQAVGQTIIQVLFERR